MISQSAQLCGSPLQHYSHWTSGASQIVSVCLFWFHLVVFGFMQAPLWTAASETPFCPSEFCILAGVLLHLVSLFAIHQWRESKENQGLSFTRLACFFLSQYFTTPPTHSCSVLHEYHFYIFSPTPCLPRTPPTSNLLFILKCMAFFYLTIVVLHAHITYCVCLVLCGCMCVKVSV